PTACQSAIAAISATQPATRLVAGTKPAPRKRTGRRSAEAPARGGDAAGAARSSKLHLARRVDGLAPDQRPQLVLQRQRPAAAVGGAALGTRHRHADDFAHPPRPPR